MKLLGSTRYEVRNSWSSDTMTKRKEQKLAANLTAKNECNFLLVLVLLARYTAEAEYNMRSKFL